MSIPQSGGGLIEHESQLAEYMESGSKTADLWRIGTEHEKFGWLTDTRLPLPYAGDRSISALFAGLGLACPALVLFPEMDAAADVPEISTACWGILGVDPDSLMCASSRMVVRRRPSPDLADPFHAQVKVVHRGVPDVVVSKGNHDAEGSGLRLIREWFPFEVLHFPIRSRAQLERTMAGVCAFAPSADGSHIFLCSTTTPARRQVAVLDGQVGAGGPWS